MRGWVVLVSTGLLVTLAGCASEPAEPAVSPAGAATVAPAAITSEVASNDSYWNEQRLAALEAAKAQFTPPPEPSDHTPAAAVDVIESEANETPSSAPAPEQALEPVAAPARQPAEQPSEEPAAQDPPPPADPVLDNGLSNDQFIDLVLDVLHALEADAITTRQATQQMRQLQVDYALTAEQQEALNQVLGELQLIFEKEHEGIWNIGDIELPTLPEVRRQMR